MGFNLNLYINYKECDYKCSRCEIYSDNCLKCSHPTRDINTNCSCKSGYFEIKEDKIEKCMKCNFRCAECKDTSDNCTSIIIIWNFYKVY